MIFWLAVGFLVGLVCGVFSVSARASLERDRLREQAKRDGYLQACADTGINPLRLLRQAREDHTRT